jgi:hypothetical protein
MLLALPATAALGQYRVYTVVVLAPDDGGDHEQLRHAIESHLSSYPVIVLLVQDGTSPEEGGAREAEARDLLVSSQALSVTWVDGEQLSILTPALHDRVTTRRVPDAGEGWAARCDAMAAVVLSELTTVFDEGLDAAVAEGQSGDGGSIEPPEDFRLRTPGPETGPGSGRAPPDVVPPPSRLGLALVLSAGYIPVRLSAAAPWVHGGSFGAGLAAGRHLEVDLGLDLTGGVPLGIPGNDGVLVRWPFRLGAMAVLPLGIVVLSGGVGAVIEVWQVRQLGYTPADDTATATRRDVGLTPLFRLRVFVLPYLAPYLEAGADLFFSSNRFVSHGSTVLERAAVVGRLAFGVSLLIPPTR